MAWAVEYTEEFEAWWNTLSEEKQAEVNTKVELLEEHGPTLPRPYADVITSSRHSNMQELRGKVEQRQLRVLYAFDPRRMALLLIGGDKTAIRRGMSGLFRSPTHCLIGTSNLRGK